MTSPLSFKAKLQEPGRRLTQHICTIPSATVTPSLGRRRQRQRDY